MHVFVHVYTFADGFCADLLQEQRGEAANLCFTLAQAHLDLVPADEEKAKIYFNEAIKVAFRTRAISLDMNSVISVSSYCGQCMVSLPSLSLPHRVAAGVVVSASCVASSISPVLAFRVPNLFLHRMH